jgi:hypothetical protein
LFEVKAKQFIVHQLKTFELAKDAHLEQEEDVVDAVLVAFIIHLGFSFQFLLDDVAVFLAETRFLWMIKPHRGVVQFGCFRSTFRRCYFHFFNK